MNEDNDERYNTQVSREEDSNESRTPYGINSRTRRKRTNKKSKTYKTTDQSNLNIKDIENTGVHTTINGDNTGFPMGGVYVGVYENNMSTENYTQNKADIIKNVVKKRKNKSLTMTGQKRDSIIFNPEQKINRDRNISFGYSSVNNI